jgi:hypothetical protein
MHVSFKLKKVQMAPATLAMVMYLLIGQPTGRACAGVAMPDHIQIDSVVCNTQPDALHTPRISQSQSLAKKSFLHVDFSSVFWKSTQYPEEEVGSGMPPEMEESPFDSQPCNRDLIER